MVTPVLDTFGDALAVAEVPVLRIGPDQEREANIGQAVEDICAPGLGADFRGRQVGAFGVIAGEAEGHGNDGDAGAVIEGVVVHAHPFAEAVAGAVPERRIGLVDAQARRLSGDQDTRAGGEPEHRIGAVRGDRGGEPVGADSAGFEVVCTRAQVGHGR